MVRAARSSQTGRSIAPTPAGDPLGHGCCEFYLSAGRTAGLAESLQIYFTDCRSQIRHARRAARKSAMALIAARRSCTRRIDEQCGVPIVSRTYRASLTRRRAGWCARVASGRRRPKSRCTPRGFATKASRWMSQLPRWPPPRRRFAARTGPAASGCAIWAANCGDPALPRRPRRIESLKAGTNSIRRRIFSTRSRRPPRQPWRRSRRSRQRPPCYARGVQKAASLWPGSSWVSAQSG